MSAELKQASKKNKPLRRQQITNMLNMHSQERDVHMQINTGWLMQLLHKTKSSRTWRLKQMPGAASKLPVFGNMEISGI